VGAVPGNILGVVFPHSSELMPVAGIVSHGGGVYCESAFWFSHILCCYLLMLCVKYFSLCLYSDRLDIHF